MRARTCASQQQLSSWMGSHGICSHLEMPADGRPQLAAGAACLRSHQPKSPMPRGREAWVPGLAWSVGTP